MDNIKINKMLAAANGANHVGEYPEGKCCPMPNKVGTIHAVCDLQEILEARHQLNNIALLHTEAVVIAEKLQAQVEQLQDKILELQYFDVDVIRCLKTMAFEHNHSDIPRYKQLAKECMDKISAGNKAAEIKAQAVSDAIPEECPHMIVFEDADREPITFAGHGAKSAAIKTFKNISLNWNAHLFVRVECNTRDDKFPSANQLRQQAKAGK